jgi:hypothetical protein
MDLSFKENRSGDLMFVVVTPTLQNKKSWNRVVPYVVSKIRYFRIS